MDLLRSMVEHSARLRSAQKCYFLVRACIVRHKLLLRERQAVQCEHALSANCLRKQFQITSRAKCANHNQMQRAHAAHAQQV